MNQKRWTIAFSVSVCLLIGLISPLHAASSPNFIIFIADDVSWDDFGCYGNTDVRTPNIDRIVMDGMKLNIFYLTASSCRPSRNSIMTGRYPHHTGAAELHTHPLAGIASARLFCSCRSEHVKYRF